MPRTTARIHFLPTRTDNTMPLADRNDYIKPSDYHATLCHNFLLTFSIRGSNPSTTTVADALHTCINTGDQVDRITPSLLAAPPLRNWQ
jgi:hypothetical protein